MPMPTGWSSRAAISSPRGQVIGYAGQTGDVTTPQLHFEIRTATTPVNPRSYLASTTASNSHIVMARDAGIQFLCEYCIKSDARMRGP